MPNWFFTFVMVLSEYINMFAELSPVVTLLTTPEKCEYKSLFRLGGVYLSLLIFFGNISLILGVFILWLICTYVTFYLIPAVMFTPVYSESKLTLAKHIAVIIVLCIPALNLANIIDTCIYSLYQKLFNKGNDNVQ